MYWKSENALLNHHGRHKVSSEQDNVLCRLADQGFRVPKQNVLLLGGNKCAKMYEPFDSEIENEDPPAKRQPQTHRRILHAEAHPQASKALLDPRPKVNLHFPNQATKKGTK